MGWDIVQIKQAVVNQLSSSDRKRDSEINTAIENCLDDISMRLKSNALLATYDVSIAVNTRTKALTGENNDLQDIWKLKIQTGDDQKTLVYVPKERFIEKYDNPSATAGIPTYYTVLVSDDSGFPVVKVDCPWSESDTMVVYYLSRSSVGTLAKFRSNGAVTQGALAYFYGIASANGAPAYAAFEKLVGLMRESDDWTVNPGRRFEMNEVDQEVLHQMTDLRTKRY